MQTQLPELYVEDLSTVLQVRVPGSAGTVPHTVVMQGVTLVHDLTVPEDCLLAMTPLECLSAENNPPVPQVMRTTALWRQSGWLRPLCNR